MTRSFFNIPSDTQLDLFPDEGGQYYIIVKERLNFAESEKLKSASLTSLHVGGQREEGESEIGLDIQRSSVMRMMIWINDWNLPDHTGKTMPVTRSAVENLETDVAEEINRLLDAHIEAQSGKSRMRSIAPVSETTSM